MHRGADDGKTLSARQLSRAIMSPRRVAISQRGIDTVNSRTFMRFIACALLIISQNDRLAAALQAIGDFPNDCPVLILRRVGGLGTESPAGIVFALWKSGAVLRADSPNRPSGSHRNA
jgi:hypothetical protein